MPKPLPKIAEKLRFPRSGRLEWIGLSPGHRAAIVEVQEARVERGTGLEGDRHARSGRGKRQVTLVQAEHLPVVEALVGRLVTPGDLRRNLMVSGLNLSALKGRPFRVGEAVLEGSGPCAPCTRMEENLGPGGLAAMQGHGGICAVVIRPGTIRVGTRFRSWIRTSLGWKRIRSIARGLLPPGAPMSKADPQPSLGLDALLGLLEEDPRPLAVLDRTGHTRLLNRAARKLFGAGAAAARDVERGLSGSASRRLHGEILPRALEGCWRGALTVCGEDVEIEARALPGSDSDPLVALWLLPVDAESECRTELLHELHTLHHGIATRLLREDDLGEVAAELLSSAARLFQSSEACLLRLRNEGRRIFRTHHFAAERDHVEALEDEGRLCDPRAWFVRSLQAGEPLVVSRDDDEASAADWLPDHGQGTWLIVPARIQGRLENLFCFHRAGLRPWDREAVSLLQMSVDSFAQGVERQIVERQRASTARDLEASIEREKAAHRYKSEFLANMSHEIRTPMNAILGYAELLGQDGALPETREQWLASLRRSTSYLLHLVNDVLDLSKIEAGHETVEIRESSLAAVLTDVRDLCAPAAKERLLDFEVRLGDDLPGELETDPVRLQQILVNLVGNAIKYTREGFVRLKVGLEAGPVEGQPLLVFEVEDSGVGIEPEELERLFQPFQRLTSAQRTRAPGTGLGLVISRHLAYLLGGDLTVESLKDQGSTFTLRLPADGAHGELRWLEPIVHRLPRPAARGLDGARVLIVDDTPENREVLRFLLQGAGARCEEAEDGAVGIDLALAAQKVGRPFDLVLMDMNMPVLDGLAATRTLVERGLEAPVVALTALASAEDEARCREAGCVDFVRKPVLPREFLQTLGTHLGPQDETVPEQAPEDPATALLGHPRFQALVERYVESFPEVVRGIREAFDDDRLDEVRTRVHRLRGTASNYGFPGIAEAAGACEDALRAGAPRQDVALLLGALIEGLDRADAG